MPVAHGWDMVYRSLSMKHGLGVVIFLGAVRVRGYF